jgi:hypothetical protein
MECGAVGHNFERDSPRDHPCQVWFNLVQRFQRSRFKKDELFNMYYRIFYELNLCRFLPIMQIRKKGGWKFKKIFSCETTEPISTKLCWNDSWVVLFHNCVRLSRGCIVHLVIKRTNWSYVKTMSCSGSHLGITINFVFVSHQYLNLIDTVPFRCVFNLLKCNQQP